ncbi:MAG: hypothetical protein FJW26_09820 [Acidimicrobiia bacterium]|nr:hypothetical protein [Acidimicrobiia bacterium]
MRTLASNFIPAVLLFSAAANTFAEEPAKGKDPAQVEADVLIRRAPGQPAQGMRFLFGQDVIAGSLDGGTFGWVASEMSFGGKSIRGAPYAAEAITETTQTLSDGNRIQRKSNASVYRDSEGRTRREQALGAIGPWAASGQPHQTIFIDDSVAGIHYILDPKERTARKIAVPSGRGGPFTAAAIATAPHQAIRLHRSEAGPGETIAFEASSTFESPLPKPQTEALGKRVIEGVEAGGTRTTMTIPAGQVGNELPIQVVSESWFSPELQVVVLSKNSDPRMGETVYRLTGISRSEQPRSLFEVPADYKIEEGGPTIQRFRTQKAEPSN